MKDNEFAREFAKENGLEFKKEILFMKVHSISNNSLNRRYASHNRYIAMHPANDGFPTRPIEWYGHFGIKSKKLLDNQSSFDCITNLSDLLLQLAKLYEKYLDEDMFIASDAIALKLTGEIKPNYKGEASLVIKNNTIRNDKVKESQKIEAKKYFINEFLDHFLGWNFGVVIKQNPTLENYLLHLNKLVIEKELRAYAGSGIDVWKTDKVQPYRFKTS